MSLFFSINNKFYFHTCPPMNKFCLLYTSDSVLNQAKTLVANGYVEIVLTGIHTAGYGEDLDNYSFYDLLVDLVKIDGLKRLRISSIETSQISDEIINLIGSNDIIVDHLHLSLIHI